MTRGYESSVCEWCAAGGARPSLPFTASHLIPGMRLARAYAARIKAEPQGKVTRRRATTGSADRVDAGGTVTLRYRSRLRHIALGRANKGRRVVLLVADRDVRVLSAEGEILRQLVLDPSRKYQPLG
jgi:hypothetical protein